MKLSWPMQYCPSGYSRCKTGKIEPVGNMACGCSWLLLDTFPSSKGSWVWSGNGGRVTGTFMVASFPGGLTPIASRRERRLPALLLLRRELRQVQAVRAEAVVQQVDPPVVAHAHQQLARLVPPDRRQHV